MFFPLVLYKDTHHHQDVTAMFLSKIFLNIMPGILSCIGLANINFMLKLSPLCFLHT